MDGNYLGFLYCLGDGNVDEDFNWFDDFFYEGYGNVYRNLYHFFDGFSRDGYLFDALDFDNSLFIENLWLRGNLNNFDNLLGFDDRFLFNYSFLDFFDLGDDGGYLD